jgi:hypothetical protein
MRTRPRREVGDRVHREGQARERPRRERPAAPLHDLAEVVRAGDPLVQTAARDSIARLAWRAQAEEHGIGPAVGGIAGHEEGQAQQEARVDQPPRAIAPHAADPPRVEEGVVHVEAEPQERHRDGHPLAGLSKAEGEDQRALQVVRQPEREQHERAGIERVRAGRVERGDGKDRRALHGDPGQAAGERRAPARAQVAAVGRGDEQRRQQRGQREREHPLDPARHASTPVQRFRLAARLYAERRFDFCSSAQRD